MSSFMNGNAASADRKIAHTWRTSEEIKLFKATVEKFTDKKGRIDYKKVSEAFDGRSISACKSFHVRLIRKEKAEKEKNENPFTPEEDRILLEARAQNTRWTVIAKILNRSIEICRKRYFELLRTDFQPNFKLLNLIIEQEARDLVFPEKDLKQKIVDKAK